MNLFGHLVGFLGRGISQKQGLYLHRTTQYRKTLIHIHAPSGIQTRDPSVRAAEDSTCHWDRHQVIMILLVHIGRYVASLVNVAS